MDVNGLCRPIRQLTESYELLKIDKNGHRLNPLDLPIDNELYRGYRIVNFNWPDLCSYQGLKLLLRDVDKFCRLKRQNFLSLSYIERFKG